jgi:hypothetical protein
MNPVWALSTFFKFHLNIILLFMFRSSMKKDFLHVFSPPSVPISDRSCVCYMVRQSHPVRFDHPNDIWRRVQIMKPLVLRLSFPASILLSCRDECREMKVMPRKSSVQTHRAPRRLYLRDEPYPLVTVPTPLHDVVSMYPSSACKLSPFEPWPSHCSPTCILAQEASLTL